VRDDGRGFDRESIPTGHFGLDIMDERAETIKAEFSVTSQPGQGTIVRLVWHADDAETNL
jgi:two-component system nitrate/nitrite sensor histidine kinase NarX